MIYEIILQQPWLYSFYKCSSNKSIKSSLLKNNMDRITNMNWWMGHKIFHFPAKVLLVASCIGTIPTVLCKSFRTVAFKADFSFLFFFGRINELFVAFTVTPEWFRILFLCIWICRSDCRANRGGINRGIRVNFMGCCHRLVL